MKRWVSNASDEVAVLFEEGMEDNVRWGIRVEHISFLIFRRILDGCVHGCEVRKKYSG